ncbi:hypothetical protein OGAPHI_004548 [Ogataea philodendri]|uniref:Autophagy-related protein 33 n=1 Tax=Ogataea philodendri TaxID=1378263 RepID=A0A9P8P3J6_9ASCO|nr:uncharacterized protein OGAPHI_004548 [Ogataea philodendri]KAH3664197.1 hypothetical protein OGAPHI_004548 [Ogataea philodendri]
MGTCLKIVKLVGIGSLGLATTSFGFAAYKTVPDIINSLNLSIASSQQLADKFKSLVLRIRVSFGTFGTLASTLFAMAFTRSPVSGKHPYLIYAALGAPLCAAYYGYSVLPLELEISKAPQKREVTKSAPKEPKINDLTSPLDNSVYNDLGTDTESVKEEVEEDEQFKELELKSATVANLQSLKIGYTYSSLVSGVAFLLATIGYLGDPL